MKYAFKINWPGIALGLALAAPALASAAVVQQDYVSSVTSRVQASAVSYELFNLGGLSNAPSISFAQALSTSPLNLSTYGTTVQNRWVDSGQTYDDKGNLTGYTRTQHSTATVAQSRTNDFSLSGHSMVVFTVNAGMAGTADLCAYKCPQPGAQTPFALGSSVSGVQLQVSGVGYTGSGSQSTRADSSGGNLLAQNSSANSLGNVWGVSGLGNLTNHYTNDQGVSFLSGMTYSSNGLLQVAFLNLSDSAISGSLYMSAFARSEWQGFGQVTAVPEPSPVALMAVGLSLLMLRRRIS